MFGLGYGELIVVLVIVVILFGSSKLPQLGRSLGEAITGFKRSINDNNTTDDKQSKLT
jgi:sec-independent protein translocase protein TatA